MDSKWGVYALHGTPENHVVPCTDSGKILRPHTLRHDCPCCPRIEVDEDDRDFIVIHNEVELH